MIRLDFDIDRKWTHQELETEANLIEKRLRDRVHHKFGFDDIRATRDALLRVFRHFDIDQSGKVSADEFHLAMKSLNVDVDKAITRHIFDRYDKDDSLSLSYEEFCNGIYGRVPAPAKSPELRHVMERVKNKIFERGGIDEGTRGLTNVLKLMDSSGDRKLNGGELKDGMQRYGVELSSSDLGIIMSQFDRDKSGTISITEFLTCLRGKMSDKRRALVEMAYKQLDKDGSGIVEFEEVCSIYDTSRHPAVLANQKTEEEVMKLFIAMWDKDKDGTITLAEFIDYYKDLSAGIDNEEYFELMIRNAWHLAGGEGAAANTSNLRVLVVHSDDSQEVVCILNDLGLSKKNKRDLEMALMKQGVTDIKRVELAM